MSLPPAPTPNYQPAPQQQNGMGVAALVLGIVALVTCWIGVIPSVLAIIFGKIGMTKADQGLANNRSMAKAGFILGIIGAALWAVIIIVVIISAATSSTSSY